MSVTTKRMVFVSIFIVMSLFAMANPVYAQSDTQRLRMTNMNIRAELGIDCDTIVLLNTEFTNIGTVEINAFDIRVDVRGLLVNDATINGSSVDTSVTSKDNFVIVTVFPNTTIPVDAFGTLFLNFTTMCLQERIGLNADSTMYDNQLIYYIRSLNEVQNLTFSVALPQHSIINQDAASPLYPNPTTNHTDGSKTIYMWYLDSLLPGQEVVYIVKYQIPAALIDTNPEVISSNPFFIGIISAILAGLAVLVVERVPAWMKRLNSRELIVSGKISSQEQEILDLLNTRGGSCPQREISEKLDMSQSMTSMMLSSLEERGLIRRLRSGRENIVHIMEED